MDDYKARAAKIRKSMVAGAKSADKGGASGDRGGTVSGKGGTAADQGSAAPRHPVVETARPRSGGEPEHRDARPSWMIPEEETTTVPVMTAGGDGTPRPAGTGRAEDRHPAGEGAETRVAHVEPTPVAPRPYPAAPAPAPAPVPAHAPTHEEIEEARNREAWMNPDTSIYLQGFLATEPVQLDRTEIRPGLRRWMYSAFHGVPFSRYPNGIRFVMRMDLTSDWERNVIIYGNVLGGFLHRDSKVKVRGRVDDKSGDLIAEEVVHIAPPVNNTVTAQGLMRAGTVRLLTMLIVLALLAVGYGVVLLAVGAGSALAVLWAGLAYTVQQHPLEVLLVLAGIGWILRGIHRFRRRRRWWRF